MKSMLERVKWYSDDNARNDLAIDTDGSYMRTTVRHKWESWQAGRAAIEIELPDITDAQYQSKHIEGGFRSEAFWLQVRKLIENVGLKVKS